MPLSGVHGNRTLMPEFPGLAKAESAHEWDAGFPLVHKIRDKDDEYWKQHRGTPKAFTLSAGQRMWANRFGNLTALRFPLPAGQDTGDFQDKVANTFALNIAPESLGLQFRDVRAEALRGASQSQDFGGLFIGFSFFLIGAALILMALLFQFGIERRAAEIGTLLALGFRANGGGFSCSKAQRWRSSAACSGSWAEFITRAPCCTTHDCLAQRHEHQRAHVPRFARHDFDRAGQRDAGGGRAI